MTEPHCPSCGHGSHAKVECEIAAYLTLPFEDEPVVRVAFPSRPANRNAEKPEGLRP